MLTSAFPIAQVALATAKVALLQTSHTTGNHGTVDYITQGSWIAAAVLSGGTVLHSCCKFLAKILHCCC